MVTNKGSTVDDRDIGKCGYEYMGMCGYRLTGNNQKIGTVTSNIQM